MATCGKDAVRLAAILGVAAKRATTTKVGLKSGALAILGCIKITAGGMPISNILGCLHAVVF